MGEFQKFDLYLAGKLIEETVRGGPAYYRSTAGLVDERSARTGWEHSDCLTERETEVLRLVADGLRDLQVAQALAISPNTVHAHLHSIYSKLGVTTRTAAARFAFDSGIA